MLVTPGHWRFRCEPAGRVLRALGGARAAARCLGVSAEYCSQWNRPASRGGTGGWIPREQWPRVLATARERKLAWIDEALLASGKREKADVGIMSRRKGALFERDVANDLKFEGLTARRVPLSGAAEGYPGDVVIEDSPSGRWVLQCKISASGGGREAVARLLAQVAVGRVETRGEVLVALRRAQFVSLVRGRPPRPVSMPRVTISGKQALDHLEGHDALVFRRSGQREWMALVREEKFGVGS